MVHLVLCLISFGAASPAQTQDAESPTASVEGWITPNSLAGPLRFLASDDLEGRGVGSRGDRLARSYLATQFQMLGMEGGAEGGSFDQPVPIVGITALPKLDLSAKGPEGEGTFAAPSDYVAFAGKPDAETSWVDAELVFVGYGITAPEYHWDDFKDADLKGKVLLVMNNDPSSDPALFAGKTRLYYGRWTYKYEEAARRGAVGAIVIHTDQSAGYPFQVIQAGQGQEHFHLPFSPEEPTLAIRAWASETCSMKLALLGGKDLDALRAQAETREFRPVPLGVKVNLATRNDVRRIDSGNIIARLEGSDESLKNEAVVVTAHFDHLGVGAPVKGDSIYNGALDNASGCSALVNIAMACSRLPVRPKRSLVFCAVTAEESGLLGSLYYSRHPTLPPKQIIANFNIDGINMWGKTTDLGMVGHGKNTLTALAESVALHRGRTIVPDAEPDKGLFYRSDHFNFARIGVPCAYFKAGSDFLERKEARRKVKNAYTTFHYHQPSDQYDDRWNLEGAAEDVRLILECLVRTANAAEAPKWTPGDEFEKAR